MNVGHSMTSGPGVPHAPPQIFIKLCHNVCMYKIGSS